MAIVLKGENSVTNGQALANRLAAHESWCLEIAIDCFAVH
jgi:hypothetical protein